MNTKLILDATRPAPPATFPARAKVPADVVRSYEDPSRFLQPWAWRGEAGR